MKITANLTICRPQGSRSECISIQVGDELSGSRIIHLEVPIADFARALTGLHIECPAEFYEKSLVGKKLEFKTEKVKPIDRIGLSPDEQKRRAKEAVAKFEVDGWQATLRDVTNSNKYTADGQVNVSFHRHVDA